MANRARIAVPRHEADSRVPRYLQVASALRRRIRDGRWSVGDKFATLEELEREFDVARVTVRQAIELLQSEVRENVNKLGVAAFKVLVGKQLFESSQLLHQSLIGHELDLSFIFSH